MQQPRSRVWPTSFRAACTLPTRTTGFAMETRVAHTYIPGGSYTLGWMDANHLNYEGAFALWPLLARLFDRHGLA